MRLEDGMLSRLVGRVIRLRMAKRKVEELAEKAAGEVVTQLNIRKTDTWSAPAGDVTKYPAVQRTISPADLFNLAGKDALNVMNVNVAQAVERYGETLLKPYIRESEPSTRLLSKPAKEEQKVTVKCP